MTSTSRKHRAARAARRQWTPADGASVFANLMRANAAAASQAPIARADITRWSLEAHSAADAIRTGTATTQHLAALFRAANITSALVAHGLGDEWTDVLNRGCNALLSLGDRHKRIGRAVFTGPEMSAVLAMLELHDAQLADDRLTEGKLLAAIAYVHQRIAAGDVDETPIPMADTPTPAQTTTTQELCA